MSTKPKTEEKAMVIIDQEGNPTTAMIPTIPGNGMKMTALPKGAEIEGDLNDFFPEELPERLPRIKVDQHEGQFVNGETEERMEELHFLIFAAAYNNILYPPIDGRKNDAPGWLCRAQDAKTPVLNSMLSEDATTELIRRGAGRKCENCKLMQWVGENKPECNHTILLGCYDVDRGYEFTMQLSRTGLKPTEKYLSNFRRMKAKPYAFITTATLEKMQRDKFKWIQVKLTQGVYTEEYPGCAGMIQYIDEMREATGKARMKATVEAEPEKAESFEFSSNNSDLDIEDIG